MKKENELVDDFAVEAEQMKVYDEESNESEDRHMAVVKRAQEIDLVDNVLIQTVPTQMSFSTLMMGVENLSVITNKFENVSFPDSKYDLVYSASAFHWVPEDIGYPKVYAMLKSGGAFARFANHPYRDKGNIVLSEEIDKLYSNYYYNYYGIDIKSQKEYSEEQAVQSAQVAEKYGFTDIRHALFHRMRTFSAKEYIELLGTYSDHIAIEETIRTEFFSKIEETINQYGGSFTLYDTIDLQLARKP